MSAQGKAKTKTSDRLSIAYRRDFLLGIKRSAIEIRERGNAGFSLRDLASSPASTLIRCD
jgi:hypothetical protein